MDLRSFASRQVADVREGGATRLWQKLTPYARERGSNKHIWHLDLDSAQVEVDRIRSILDGPTTPAIDVVYDNRCSPPAYGNFLEAAMTARYLATRGAGVRFAIVDSVPRRPDWDQHLTSEGQESFVRDQLRTASALLGCRVEIVLERSGGSARASSAIASEPGRHVLFGEFVRSREAWYSLAPTLMHRLVAAQGSSVPKGFLLGLGDFPDSAADVSREHPYIAWAVRRSPERGTLRDSTARQVLSDFRSIARRFPNHKIMLFSTPPGLAFARRVLGERLKRSWRVEARLVDQPASDFAGAIPWLLGSDLYFQRIGGGMGSVAAFSEVPYRIVLTDTGTFTSYTRGRVAAWSRDDQRWSTWPAGARYRRIHLRGR